MPSEKFADPRLWTEVDGDYTNPRRLGEAGVSLKLVNTQF
jgi:hypothetical protein